MHLVGAVFKMPSHPGAHVLVKAYNSHMDMRFVSAKPLVYSGHIKPESDNSFTRHVRTQCSSWTEEDVVVRSQVAQAPRSAWISQFGFSPDNSPDNFHTTTLQRTKKSPSAVTEPSALALAPAFGHLTVGAGRILANLEISSPVRTSCERVSWKGDRGQTRATFSNFRVPLHESRRDSSQD